MTDYTLVPEIFKSAFSQEPKFEHLKGRVVKVRVRGSLVERASNMPMVNSYYILEKLRFWQTGETWACDIKGNNGHIEKLNPANAEHNGMAEVKRCVVPQRRSSSCQLDYRRKKELGSSVTESGTASRARSLITDPGEKQPEITTGIPTGGQMGPPMVSALPPKEELPTCFEVKARILDFYPIALDEDDCLLRVCGDCKNSSVPYLIFSRSFVLNASSKDRKVCGVVPELFEHGPSSACGVPLLTSIHVGYGKRRRARGNGWNHRRRPRFDDQPTEIIV